MLTGNRSNSDVDEDNGVDSNADGNLERETYPQHLQQKLKRGADAGKRRGSEPVEKTGMGYNDSYWRDLIMHGKEGRTDSLLSENDNNDVYTYNSRRLHLQDDDGDDDMHEQQQQSPVRGNEHGHIHSSFFRRQQNHTTGEKDEGDPFPVAENFSPSATAWR